IGILVLSFVSMFIARQRGLSLAYRQLPFAAPMVVALVVISCWLAGRLPIHQRLLAYGGWAEQHPLLLMLTYWLLPMLLVVIGFRATTLGRMDAWSGWFEAWLLWDVLGVLSAWFAPGVSYLFILPGVVAALTGFVAALLSKPGRSTLFLSACCIAAV